ncbi:hypothetical protein [Mycobacterium hodleri]|uniref:hypothetical protein n=1 Tax=Mycolicibacterium hodleri TaxID=49897 RepID=UPI001375E208
MSTRPEPVTATPEEPSVQASRTVGIWAMASSYTDVAQTPRRSAFGIWARKSRRNMIAEESMYSAIDRS